MGIKLNSAPVYYTLAQVQFNPILDLETYMPLIQAEMRKAHFPDFKREVIQQFMMPMDPGQIAPPSAATQTRYLFGDINSTSSFVLDNNALVLQCTNYDTFETFLATLLQGLKTLDRILQLDFVERIGVRYLDAVQPKDGETLKDYLIPEVLGLSMYGVGSLQQSFSETGAFTPAGQLISRVIIRDGQVGLPMELNALAPTIAPRFMEKNSLHAIVDTDCFAIQREPFNIANIEAHLMALHDQIVESFRVMVTRYALDSWA
ncbi:TIGR04255 family protein [Raoultella ornithinolytica]|uniref:TIGR04255 family protein n=1 Tax=Raoultella ornithinolytica TaxID=54291 RepID=UPI001A2C317C|nr:TIGR04255 family protein [Raoultella ornithinolytica]MCF1304154.1 TIGR04255 family protein [Raoultella ornithinolytica]HAT1602169.1 TIGR04255 family protein [Raoultella ornithinolytica]